MNHWNQRIQKKRYPFGRFGVILNRVTGWLIIAFGALVFLTTNLGGLLSQIQYGGSDALLTGGFFFSLLGALGPVITGVGVLIFADLLEAILDAGDNSFRR